MYQGQSYDGVMRDIVGNHVACVDSARVATAMVGDAAPRRRPSFAMPQIGHPPINYLLR
jgi:hypothetical protein